MTPINTRLVRLGAPSHGDTIHRATCHFAKRPNAVEWWWAENNPTVDWKKETPWLVGCLRCNPPSPLAPGKEER